MPTIFPVHDKPVRVNATPEAPVTITPMGGVAVHYRADGDVSVAAHTAHSRTPFNARELSVATEC